MDALLHLCGTTKLINHQKTEKMIHQYEPLWVWCLVLQNAVVRGTLLGLQYMGKDEGGEGGVVVNVASILGLAPFASSPVYVTTKHAVIGLTRSFGVSTACSNWIFCTGLQWLLFVVFFLSLIPLCRNFMCRRFGTQRVFTTFTTWRKFEIKELFVGKFRSVKILKTAMLSIIAIEKKPSNGYVASLYFRSTHSM